jgi:zinc protease
VAPLIVGASVQTDATGASIRETLSEVRGMLASEVGADELKLAKESLSRSLPALFETSESTVATIGNLYLYDLPPGYYESLPARIDALTSAEVWEATRRHVAPDRMVVIAVGDGKMIEPQIAPLGIGPIGHRSPDGKIPEAVARR